MHTATITDVSVRAGVSIKTVSRVLNNELNVRDATRQKVLMAVRELDYRPNLSARSLAGARSFLIGLFFDNPSPAYVSDVQLGAVSRCRASGRHLVIEPVDSASQNLGEDVRKIVSTLRLDGAILTPPVGDDARVMDALERSGTPYVRIAPDTELGRAPRVCMDDHRAAFDMTSRLIELGHRHIGFIKGHPKHGATNLRYQGFLDAMNAHGIAPRADHILQGFFSFQSGFECGDVMLSGPERPTAIFASNDDMALGVMAAASRLRVSVPGQLSIAGFDDTPAAQTVWPPLTTIAQPIFDMAACATDMLIGGGAEWRVRDGLPPVKVLDFRLIVRASTAAPVSG